MSSQLSSNLNTSRKNLNTRLLAQQSGFCRYDEILYMCTNLVMSSAEDLTEDLAEALAEDLAEVLTEALAEDLRVEHYQRSDHLHHRPDIRGASLHLIFKMVQCDRESITRTDSIYACC